MAIQSLYPTARPTLNVDFANGKFVDPRLTFSRSSTATYYDGRTSTKAEENLLLQSEFAASWVNFGTNGLTANSTTAPNGTTTAALVTSPAATDYTYQVPATVIGLAYTFSYYVKNSTATVSHYHVRNASTAALGTLTWSGSTLSSVTASTGTASFVDVGSGWYRVSVFYTALETNARHRIGGGDNSAAAGNIYVWGAQVEQRSFVSAYTPTTTQTVTNYVPTLLTAAVDAPRFDHDPVTGECRGILVEAAATNLLGYSSFQGTYSTNSTGLWYDSASAELSLTNNQAIAPDGTNTALRFRTNTTTGYKYIRQQTGTTSTGAHTCSVYVKAASTSTTISITVTGESATTNYGRAAINFVTGAVSGLNNAGTATGTAITSTAVGNGWYRVQLTTTLATATGVTVIIYPGVYSAQTSADDFYIWGAQLETGAGATSYIPTTTASVTRSTDVLSSTGTNFTSWYNQDQGTLIVDFERVVADAAARFTAALYADSANYLGLDYSAAIAGGTVYWRNNSAGFSAGSVGGSMPANKSRYGLAYSSVNGVNTALGTTNGGTPASISSTTTPPLVTSLQLGRQTNGAFVRAQVFIRKVVFYPEALTSTQLQAITL